MSKQNGYIARVLVVEDEPDLREAMVSYLNLEGFLPKASAQSSIQLPLETDHGLGYAFAAKITLAAIQD